jgi:hypothetical protein
VRLQIKTVSWNRNSLGTPKIKRQCTRYYISAIIKVKNIITSEHFAVVHTNVHDQKVVAGVVMSTSSFAFKKQIIGMIDCLGTVLGKGEARDHRWTGAVL